jgi:hypothetical protein
MKLERLTLTFVIVVCTLFMQAGCEEEAMAPRELNPNFFNRFGQPDRQIATSGSNKSSKSSPRIAFDKDIHDFGNVGPETSRICEFRFTNIGDGILKIDQVTKTCGCTPFLLTKNQYAPGESGTLKVKYYSDTQRGLTTKHLYVHSNDRVTPKVELAIKARIITKVNYEPKTLSLLLERENAGCPKITLSSIDNQPFSIKNFRSTANCVTADFNPSVKATSFVLQPKVNMARLEKTLNGRIEIDLTHPECKTISLGLNTLPKFQIAPRSIIARGLKPNKPIVKQLRILNNYNEDFELESASSKKGIVRVLSKELVRNGYELQLQITPPATGNKTRVFSDVLSVKIKGGKKLDVPCSGFYTGATGSSLTSATDSKTCKTCKPVIMKPSDWKKKGS